MDGASFLVCSTLTASFDGHIYWTRWCAAGVYATYRGTKASHVF